jgi:hypothetical protein
MDIHPTICSCDVIKHPNSTLLKYNKFISMIDFPALFTKVCRGVTSFHIPDGHKMGMGTSHKIEK